MRGVGAVLLGIAVLLTGCAGGDSVNLDVGPDDEVVVGAARTTPSLGAIDGVVTDESLLPLGNVTVNLTEAGVAGTTLDTGVTDRSGRFAFSLLTPGAYRITASADGYAISFVLVSVRAAEVTSAQVTLGAVATQEPYIALQIWSGLIPCEFATVVTVFPCEQIAADQMDNLGNFDVPDGWAGLVVESDWDRDTDSLRMDVLQEGYLSSTQWPWKLVHGRPILHADILPGVQYPPSGPSALGLEDPPPVPEDGYVLQVFMSYLGSYQETINETLAPMCAQHPLGYCSGAGPGIEFRFDVYTSVFMHDRPQDLRTYTAVPDR